MRTYICLLLVLLLLPHNVLAHNTVPVVIQAAAPLSIHDVHPLGNTNVPSPAPAQKLTWVKIKKHLKRYWRRYALAAAAAGLALEHVHTKQVAHRPRTTTLTSGERSVLERFAKYQFDLLQKALTWSPRTALRTLQKNTSTLLKDSLEQYKRNGMLQQARLYKSILSGKPIRVSRDSLFYAPTGTSTVDEYDERDVIGETFRGTVRRGFEPDFVTTEQELKGLHSWFNTRESNDYGMAVDRYGTKYSAYYPNGKKVFVPLLGDPSAKYRLFFDAEKRPCYLTNNEDLSSTVKRIYTYDPKGTYEAEAHKRPVPVYNWIGEFLPK